MLILHLINMRQNRLYIILFLCSLWLALPLSHLSAQGKDFTLVIDPGHGGKDPGAIGKKGKEKNINLSVALKLGNLIKENCKDVKSPTPRPSPAASGRPYS